MTQVLSPPFPSLRNPLRARSRALAAAVLIIAVAVGLALRVAAAQGPLGLDEFWSLRLAASLPSIGDAFWGLPHDNNHALNTAAMVALGPDRPAWVYRAPSLVFGTLTILAMARVLAPKGVIASTVGAILAAASLPLVDFGSEARGYAGLVLASVLAIDQWQRAMSGPDGETPSDPGWHGRWGLAAAAGLGAFSHLAMVMTVAVLVTATLMLIGTRSHRVGVTLAVTARLFAPTVVALVPAALALVIAIRRGGGFQIGNVDPFTPAKLAGGLGDIVALALGLPPSLLSPLFAGIVLACLAAAVRRRLLDPRTTALCIAAFVALPVALWAAHIPNVGYARYFAICAIALLMALAEIVGRLWVLGRTSRTLAAAGLGAVLAASLLGDLHAIRVGRSPGPETLAIIKASGNLAFATSQPQMAELLLGKTTPARPEPSPAVGACEISPEWYIAVGVFDPRPSGTITLGSGVCRQIYRTFSPFASNPLSGTQWTLYRRTSQASSGAMTVWPGSGARNASSSSPQSRLAASSASKG